MAQMYGWISRCSVMRLSIFDVVSFLGEILGFILVIMFYNVIYNVICSVIYDVIRIPGKQELKKSTAS